MKHLLARIVQPKNPLFWLMVVLQLLSSFFLALLNMTELAPGLAWVLRLMVLLNAVLGILILWKLLRGGGRASAGRTSGSAQE